MILDFQAKFTDMSQYPFKTLAPTFQYERKVLREDKTSENSRVIVRGENDVSVLAAVEFFKLMALKPDQVMEELLPLHTALISITAATWAELH